MKKVSDNQLNGELGETVVKATIMSLGHVFEGRGRLETGIDGTIEFRDPQTRAMTGKMVAVQVKTTDRQIYTAESDAGFEYLMKMADVEYWRQTSLPVVIVLYRQSDQSLYWKSVAASVPGEERRLVFDKAADKLDAAAMDRLAAVAIEKGRLGAFLPPMRTGEPAHLNLMRIGMPDEIFVADSPFASGRDAVPVLLRADGHHFDWVIRGRRFVSFRDPRGTPLESIIDIDTVEAVDTELIADSDDHDDEIVMIELLRRTMAEQFAHELAYNRKGRIFFFKAEDRHQPRRYHYRSLKEVTSAMVVQVYPYKKGKRVGQIHSVRHHGFSPRFERIGSEWFLSISPTFAFTEDGFRPHRFAADLLSGKKRKDRNGSIRGQFFLFRFLLSGAQLTSVPELDLFPTDAATIAPAVLTFEPIEPVLMDVAVPEGAWAVSDPNAKKMKAEAEDGPVQTVMEMHR